jgi:hypothetical protein
VDSLLILEVSKKRIGLIGPTGKWPTRSAYSRNGKTHRLKCHRNNRSIRGHLYSIGFEKPDSAQMRRTLTAQIIQRENYPLFRCRLEIFLFEPTKPHSRLSQVVPFVTDWELARSPQRVGSMSSEGRVVFIGWAFHDQPHGR